MNKLRQRLKAYVGRVRRFRRRRYLAMVYNLQRQRYYANSSRKYISSELLVSIVVPAYNPRPSDFEQLLSSVFAQSYPHWELVIADGSTDPAVRKFLARKSHADTRIKYLPIKNKGIASTTNAALDAATGDIIAFLDHDDSLDPDALAYGVEQFEIFPETGLVYSDEDKLTETGEEFLDPHYKPDFSLDLLRNVNYITHFVMVRTKTAHEAGDIRMGFEGAQDYDFLLRVVDTGAEVRHVPRILYHWRLSGSSTAADFSNKAFITEAGEKALADHYYRRKITNVKVKAIKDRPGFYQAHYLLSHKKRAILVFASNETPGVIRRFIEQTYARNESISENGIKLIFAETTDKVDLADYDSVMVVRGLVVPGHDDSDLAQLFAVAEESGVYAVSPKLVSNGRITDMGLVSDGSSSPLTALFHGMEPNDFNVFGSSEWVHNVNALTGTVVVLSGSSLRSYKPHNLSEITQLAVPSGSDKRFVIWAHVEMLSLDDFSAKEGPLHTQSSYYNSNLTQRNEPVVRGGIDAVEVMLSQGFGND